MGIQGDMQVWRYMSFGSLVRLLETKKLWLSNAEYFSDKWELVPDISQINSIMNNRPPTQSPEVTKNGISTYIKDLRKNAYINCWTASRHESYALWKIYCPTSEGVVIQTTFEKLQESVPLPVLEVKYESYKANGKIPEVSILVTQKRPIFSYEQEVRIVAIHDFSELTKNGTKMLGFDIDWDPEIHLENIWIHPEATYWFADTVTETVNRLAPKLGRHVPWSKISYSPPV